MGGQECRSATHECDLPEYCSGDSEYCPEDVFKVDGSTCEKNNVCSKMYTYQSMYFIFEIVLQAYCFEGSCRTHSDQCRLLWGPTGESSSILCYKMNNRGSQQGNCGYNRLNKTYAKCQNE